MLFACSKMLSASWSISGACHPPCAKPSSRSSSGPPGACATPSSVTNSVTMSLPMASSFPGNDAPVQTYTLISEAHHIADPVNNVRGQAHLDDEVGQVLQRVVEVV